MSEGGRYVVQYAPRAVKELTTLDRPVERRLATAIERLGADPGLQGARILAGYPELWRIRTGDYRVIYTIKDAELIVLALTHRAPQEQLPQPLTRAPRSLPQNGGVPSGASRSRTGDLLLAKQALSQLSYGPAGRMLAAAFERSRAPRWLTRDGAVFRPSDGWQCDRRTRRPNRARLRCGTPAFLRRRRGVRELVRC